jgi:hypothetical protein
VVGFFGRLGRLEVELAGRVPFQFTAPNFVPESCALRLRIGGGGGYDVLVDESAAGAEGYTLTFHCMTGPNGTGIQTGSDQSNLQDQ